MTTLKDLEKIINHNEAVNGVEAVEFSKIAKKFACDLIEKRLMELLEETGEQFEDDIQDFYESETNTIELDKDMMNKEEALILINNAVSNLFNFIQKINKKAC